MSWTARQTVPAPPDPYPYSRRFCCNGVHLGTNPAAHRPAADRQGSEGS